jgi:hypothetical protein
MMLMMMLDYVSKLRQTTNLLIIQVIEEHGGTWWNDIDRVKLLIRPPELCSNLTSRAI